MALDPFVVESIVAALLPLLIAVFKKVRWSSTTNALVAVAVYVGAGIAAVGASGEPFDLANIVPSVTTFVTIGTVAYQAFWKNWGDPQVAANVLP